MNGSLFLPLTPYHVFLACGISLDRNPERSNDHLVLIESFPGSSDLLEHLRSWEESRFRRVDSLPGALTQTSEVVRGALTKLNELRLRRLLKSATFERLYLFNDSRPESQAAARHLSKRAPNHSVTLVEDGTAIYADGKLTDGQSWAKRLGKRMLYAPAWEEIDVLGASSMVSEVLASYPDCVRPELNHKAIRPLRSSMFRRSELTRFAKNHCDASLGSMQLNGLILLPHSSFCPRERFLRKALDLIRHRLSLPVGHVGVKAHPRETCNTLTLATLQGVDLVHLPQGLGAEFIYLAYRNQLRFVVGHLSSALFSARWLLPSVQVVSLGRLLGEKDHRLVETLEHVGVHIPSPTARESHEDA